MKGPEAKQASAESESSLSFAISDLATNVVSDILRRLMKREKQASAESSASSITAGGAISELAKDVVADTLQAVKPFFL